jgi:hypothetical protein
MGTTANPDIPLQLDCTTELHSWLDSGRAMHSAWYWRPGEFVHHETAMVVGGGPSAMDLCQIGVSNPEMILKLTEKWDELWNIGAAGQFY